MSNEQQGTPVPPQVPQNNEAPQQQGWQGIGQQPAQPAQPAPPAQPQAWQATTPAPQPQAWQQPTQAPQPPAWQQPTPAPQPPAWQQPNPAQQQAWQQQAAAQQAAAQQSWGQGQQQWQQPAAAGATAPTWDQLKATGRFQTPPEYPAATFHPEKFSIAAFFFSWIWYMVKGMWQKGLVILAGGMVISFITGGLGGIAVAIYAGMYGHRDYVRYYNSKIQFWW